MAAVRRTARGPAAGLGTGLRYRPPAGDRRRGARRAPQPPAGRPRARPADAASAGGVPVGPRVRRPPARGGARDRRRGGTGRRPPLDGADERRAAVGRRRDLRRRGRSRRRGRPRRRRRPAARRRLAEARHAGLPGPRLRPLAVLRGGVRVPPVDGPPVDRPAGPVRGRPAGRGGRTVGPRLPLRPPAGPRAAGQPAAHRPPRAAGGVERRGRRRDAGHRAAVGPAGRERAGRVAAGVHGRTLQRAGRDRSARRRVAGPAVGRAGPRPVRRPRHEDDALGGTVRRRGERPRRGRQRRPARPRRRERRPARVGERLGSSRSPRTVRTSTAARSTRPWSTCRAATRGCSASGRRLGGG